MSNEIDLALERLCVALAGAAAIWWEGQTTVESQSTAAAVMAEDAVDATDQQLAPAA